MRPARKGPENPRAGSSRSRRRSWLFNEAGPQGAGKPAARLFAHDEIIDFNEAGPQGAGKPHPGGIRGRTRTITSMRPARKGPENRTTSGK